MIFDHHEMIDDWNISESWVDDLRHEDWWEDHIVGGLITADETPHSEESPDRREASGVIHCCVGARFDHRGIQR